MRIHFIFSLAIVFIMTMTLVPAVSAADKWEYLSVKEALQSGIGKEKLDSSIKIYMKGQKRPSANNITKEFKTNKRARKFGRSAEEACQFAFVSAMITFQERAQKEGRNAVVELYSITKDKVYENSGKYSCLVGGMVANVAIKGKVANIK